MGVVVLATAVAGGASAKAKQTKFSAALGIAQEVPKETGASSSAHGVFTATLKGTTLTWKLTFANLTSKAIAAHIHLGLKGNIGPAVVALCGPCRSPVSGSEKITSAMITALRNGTAYVNVHTSKNPGGEVRGQVK